MKSLNKAAIQKLTEISEPNKAVSVTPEEAEFLLLETWDTDQTVGEEDEDGQ